MSRRRKHSGCSKKNNNVPRPPRRKGTKRKTYPQVFSDCIIFHVVPICIQFFATKIYVI
jgi:hypothetical protein